MTELEKIVRVIKKADSSAPHETLLVLDAGTGQKRDCSGKRIRRLRGCYWHCVDQA